MSAPLKPTYRPRTGVQRQRVRATPPPPAFAALSRSPSPAITNTRTCKRCGSSDLSDEDGSLVCRACGLLLHEDPGFRAEQEFDESEGGRAVQRGTRVGENQTHQRQFTSRVPGQSRYGPGLEQTPLAEKAKSEAQGVFQRYAALLEIRQPEINAAMEIFKLSYSRGFYRGRTLTSVAVACLYLATRRAQQPYPLMLIDFAELDNFNVFDLGKMCQDLKKTLYLDQKASDGSMDENETIKLRMVDPEHLIEKFCDRLDFGPDEQKIKLDAIRLVKCMKRDWMSHGRRPAGVAGAAVILAARMNNYRRTLREVVLVAKVAELTVSKRIEEFQETKSGGFSVKEFRQHDIDSIRGSDVQDPPAYYRSKPEFQKPKRKRGRPAKNFQPETAAEIEGDEPQVEQLRVEPSPKRARIDADGFAVPELPPRDLSQKKLGRPPGARNWRAPPPSDEELEEESQLSHAIQEQLDENADLDPTRDEEEEEGENVIEFTPPPMATPPSSAPSKTSKGPAGPAVNTDNGNLGNVSLSPTLKATEFEDDIDVANCVLSTSEKRNKEIIWVTENADWLRQEHAKKIRRELKDKELREKGIDPDKERARNKAKRRKDGMMKSGRTGDVSYLDKSKDGQDEEATNQRERSASQSVMSMLQQRGVYSRRVDYEKLANAYKLPGADEGDSIGPSRSGSVQTAREDSVASVDSNVSRVTGSFFGPNKNKGQTKLKVVKEAREQNSRSPSVESGGDNASDRSPSVSSDDGNVQVANQKLLPAEEVIDSPLSSTHTPIGYDTGVRAQAQEDDSDGDEDDYWDEDEGNEQEDDPEKFFQQPDAYVGEEEVVEDD